MATFPPPSSVNLASIAELLDSWIQTQAPPESQSWLADRLEKLGQNGDEKTLFLTFGMIPRKFGKADLKLSETDRAKASEVRAGWNPERWTIDQVARTRLLLAMAENSEDEFVERLDRLFASGEVGELVALYQALPVLPHQTVHTLRAAEGVRTNIKPVFCAVAHHNPYPAEHLEEGRWNQMVLKCLFIEVPLAPIVGLDQRANAALSRMLVDYAHERWAAGRTVSPELWRCVGPYADETALKDLARVLETGSETEKKAAALALSACPREKAKAILEPHRQLTAQTEAGLTWDTLES